MIGTNVVGRLCKLDELLRYKYRCCFRFLLSCCCCPHGKLLSNSFRLQLSNKELGRLTTVASVIPSMSSFGIGIGTGVAVVDAFPSSAGNCVSISLVGSSAFKFSSGRH